MKAPMFLIITTTFGFFALLGLLFFIPIPADSAQILAGMIGSVGAAWGAIIGYHFGSSSGSAAKTAALINGKATEPQPPNEPKTQLPKE